MDNTDVVLIIVLVWLFLSFLALTAVAIFTRYLFTRKALYTLHSNIKTRLPKIMLVGYELMDEVGKEIGEKRMESLAVWFVRIPAIIMALATAFAIGWILAHI